MADYGSSIRQLPPSALDPDHLEQQFASQMHGPEGGYQMPFLMHAMLDRQRRGQQLIDANRAGNQQAYDLAQQAMAVDERGQLRSMAGTLGPHGMPTDPNLLMVGGMPTPQSASAVAAAGNPILMQHGQAETARDLGAGAHAALQGGVDPLALPGMPQARVTPLGLLTARAGSGAARETWTLDEQGNPSVQFRNPADPSAAIARGQAIVQGNRSAVTGRQMLSTNQQLNAAVTEYRQRVTGGGNTIVSEGGDSTGNLYTMTARDRNGRTETVTLDRQGRRVSSPAPQR